MQYNYGIELSLPVNEQFCYDFFWQRLRKNNFGWNTIAQMHKNLGKQGWYIISKTCTSTEDAKAVYILEELYRLAIQTYYLDKQFKKIKKALASARALYYTLVGGILKS